MIYLSLKLHWLNPWLVQCTLCVWPLNMPMMIRRRLCYPRRWRNWSVGRQSVLACGYHNIWIAEPNPFRRSMLEQLDNFNTYDPAKYTQCPQGVDVIIDAVGSGATRRTASSMVRPGGVIVHISLQDNLDGLDSDASLCRNHPGHLLCRMMMLKLCGCCIITLCGSGWVDVRPLADGPKAFHDIHNGAAPPKIILDVS